MIESEITNLKEAAEMATPGPWYKDRDFPEVKQSHTDIVAVCSEHKKAEFIALANPATILKLLEERDLMIEALKWYGNKESWEWTTHETTFDGCGCTDFSTIKIGPGSIVSVGGKRAREALSKVRGGG